MSERKVRVRFAPSPTGPLHIGGVRTALYNYLFARKHNGDFILRIEDTDSQRYVKGAEEYILESFAWLGIQFDEGVGIGGNCAPYRQSERKTIYRKYVDQLLNAGLAYMAFDTSEQLEEKRAAIPNFQYDAHTRIQGINSLTLSAEEVKKRLSAGEKYVVRIKVEPDQEIEVQDLIRGRVVVNSNVLDDKVLYKSADELPTYHLANIVDDHLMDISHVIRGEEWLPSAPLHILLYRYLGWEDSMPQFAHLPLLLKPEGNGKLNKRDGDRLGFPVFPLKWEYSETAVSLGYREAGYLPEAVINFLALLGWNPGIDRELFSMEELIELFSLDRVSKSGARFDFEKAKWFNHEYLMAKPDDEIAEMYRPLLEEKGISYDPVKLPRIVSLVKNRIYFINDLWEQTSFFFETPDIYDEKAVKKYWKADTPQLMRELIIVLEGITDFTAANTEKVVLEWITSREYNMGAVMNAFRIAVVGAGKGPHMFDIIEVLGKKETLARIEKAINIIK